MKRILLLTNKDDVTTDYVVHELKNRNIPYYRLNTEEIINSIDIELDFVKSNFQLYDRIKEINLNFNEFQAIYYRRPELPTLNHIIGLNDDELNFLRAETVFILEGIYKLLSDRFWLNDVYRIREAENKIYQLQLAKQIGFLIPNSLIANKYDSIINFYNINKHDCIIKPIKSGNFKSSTTPKAIFTNKIVENQLVTAERIEAFPIFMQERVQKCFDLRVTVIGSNVYCAEIHSQEHEDSSVDWRKGSNVLEHKIHILPNEITQKCYMLTKMLGLNYSAIDLILNKDGEYIFLEINPNGQWAWIESRLGFPISKDMVSILEGALYN